MSFTAQVKDELSRVEGECPECAYAQLSAITRVCGTLTLAGGGRFSVRVATETGSVARVMIKLVHNLFGLDTPLTVRRSNLHRTSNYLIEIPQQPGLGDALVRLGILDARHHIVPGVPQKLVERDCCARAYVRGAFMAGGFIADPRGDFHLEIALSSEDLARDVSALLFRLGIFARLNHRRGSYVLYLKSFDQIEALLAYMGAERSAQATANVRRMKSLKSDVNRRVNAELANQARSVDAAADQLELIGRARRLVGFAQLPRAVREFCLVRAENPSASLTELGRLCSPPASKSAMYHRLLRLEHIVAEAEENAAARPGE